MSDWINDEAEKLRKAQEQDKQSNHLINYSNYWANLIRQLETDVERINAQAIWNDLLSATPVKLMSYDGGYKIEKRTMPAVSIYVKNQGQEVTLRTLVIEIIEDNTKDTTEVLSVVTRGDQICLQRHKDLFVVPEQASQFMRV